MAAIQFVHQSHYQPMCMHNFFLSYLSSSLMNMLVLQVTDADVGINSQVRFSFIETEGDGSNRFEIDPETGDVISTASFLGQAGAAFRLTVRATDRNGDRGLTSTKTLLVSCTASI